MLRCNILSIFLAFSLLAGAQDWKVVRENSQKAFPKTVTAGNYSGIAHLHDDIYAVVSDKSDSALYFNFRIQVNPKTGELEQVENLGFTERTDGTLNDGKFWQGQEKGFDHEAIVKASDSTLVITSEGYCRLKGKAASASHHRRHQLWWIYPISELKINNYCSLVAGRVLNISILST